MHTVTFRTKHLHKASVSPGQRSGVEKPTLPGVELTLAHKRDVYAAETALAVPPDPVPSLFLSHP